MTISLLGVLVFVSSSKLEASSNSLLLLLLLVSLFVEEDVVVVPSLAWCVAVAIGKGSGCVFNQVRG